MMRFHCLRRSSSPIRDACEWSKMRALFAEKDAYVFTTWSGGVPIDEFIKVGIRKPGFWSTLSPALDLPDGCRRR